MPKQRSYALNGKFLSASPTGVHRVAYELISALDKLLCAEATKAEWRLLKPRDADRSILLSQIIPKTVGVNTWQPWEQLDLAVAARQDVLVSLCNLAPLLHPASIVMMHDAQVFSTPESYNPRFRLWYQMIQPAIGRHAKQVLTVSEFSKQELVRYRVAEEAKITVVHNGCDHMALVTSSRASLDRLTLAPRSYVVALANVQAHKNITLLFRAFEDERLRDLRLVLVGKATRADFEAVGSSAPSSVIFAGPVSDAELKGLYEEALCLAFPSTTEGFGLPPLEAMFTGCPVVAAPCGALPEVCGDAAIYAPPTDAAAWAQAISMLASDSKTRAQWSTMGRRHAQAFTWERSARRLLEAVRAAA